jgi:hypothetical protein
MSPYGNAVAVEIGHLLEQIQVLEQDGPAMSESSWLATRIAGSVGPRPAVVVLGYQHSSLEALVASEFTSQNELGLASLTGVKLPTRLE